MDAADTILERQGIIILGSGYTGRFLAPLAAPHHSPVFVTSRTPETHLPDVPASLRVRFDLQQPSTWMHIPPSADLIWCFPAEPLELVRRFSATLDSPARRIVVLGSTSAYNLDDSPAYPPAWIDETAPVNLTTPRVQGEEYLRKEHGAIILRVAGIYGPGRNPLNWIRNGRIGSSRKYVNLIHVEDLASICLAALNCGKPGEVYNVSDGTPRTWEEICAAAHLRWGLPATSPRNDRSPGKRIDQRKLISELGVRIRHSDLFTVLDSLER